MGCVQSNPQVDGPQKLVSSKTDIRTIYHFKDILGKGQFGEVYMAVLVRDTSVKVSIKSMNKHVLNMSINQIYDEISILKSLDHPSVLKFYEVYEDEDYIYLVTEHCSGGTLFDYIEYYDPTESEIAQIFLKILEGVAYLHSQGIIHRDLKPQNILFKQENDKLIKIIDFGFSRNKTETKKSVSIGTPLYMSPEQIKDKSETKSDIWSLGIMLYYMSSTTFPFVSNDLQELYQTISSQPLIFFSPAWESRSEELIGYIELFLEKQPNKRIDCKTAIQHPWLQRYKQRFSTQLSNQIGNRKLSNKLKKNVIVHFQKHLNEKELQNIEILFKQTDKDHNGYISYEEVMQADISEENRNSLQNILRDNKDGEEISFSQFLELAINQQKVIILDQYFTNEFLTKIFNLYDANQDGLLCANDVMESLLRQGIKKTDEEIKEWIRDFDENDDGFIQLQEFLNTMQKN